MKKDLIPKHLQDIRDNYCKNHKKTRGVTNGRIFVIRATLNAFFIFLQTKGISDLNKLNTTHFIQHQYYLYRTRGVSTHAVRRHIKDLKYFFNVLFYEGKITVNPAAQITLIDPPDLSVNKITRYHNLTELRKRWGVYLTKESNCAYSTIKRKLLALDLFYEYLNQNQIKTVYKIDSDILEGFKQYLKQYTFRKPNEPIEINSNTGNDSFTPYVNVFKLRCICQFFMYLYRQRLIKNNPSEYIKLKQYFLQLSDEQSSSKKTVSVFYGSSIPEEVNQLIDKYKNYFTSSGNCENTAKNHIRNIKQFWQYISERNVTDLKRVTKTIVMDYQTHVSNMISPTTNNKYAPSTVLNAMIAIRSFFRFLVKYDYLICDPTSILDLPKNTQGLGHSCMTEREIKQILDQPNTDTPVGIRDKAILEALYSTGVRANELANVEINHVDLTGGLIRIEYPKGGKSYQRVIPIGQTACNCINLYLKKVRPYLKNHLSKDYLFLTNTGTPVERHRMLDIVKKYVHQTGLRKNVCTHSFRVSCATHMLKNNADIRYVQEQLGHRSIKTTQGYTRLVPKDLKAIHTKCHPREKQNMV